jgi:hypothetical protein
MIPETILNHTASNSNYNFTSETETERNHFYTKSKVKDQFKSNWACANMFSSTIYMYPFYSSDT